MDGLIGSCKYSDITIFSFHPVKIITTEEIGLATVYRVLTQFEQAGICIRHNFEEGHAIYELTPESHHDHMICLDTGDIIEFTSDEIELKQSEVAKEKGYEIVDHSMVLYVRPIKK